MLRQLEHTRGATSDTRRSDRSSRHSWRQLTHSSSSLSLWPPVLQIVPRLPRSCVSSLPSPPLPPRLLVPILPKYLCRVVCPSRATPLLLFARLSFRVTSLPDASMSNSKHNDDEGNLASRTRRQPRMRSRNDDDDDEKQHAAQPPAHVSPAMRIYRHALESIFAMLQLHDLFPSPLSAVYDPLRWGA